MRTQHEKNKEKLMEEIERLCGQPMNNSVAEKLSVYHGAFKAMCMAEKWGAEAYSYKGVDHHEPTLELDGDTEFERVIMSIPADRAHMVELTHILNRHMGDLAATNRRAYDRILAQLREVAES